MAKSRYGNILVIDNDVLVYLHDYVYQANPGLFDLVFGKIIITYGRIWLPETVEKDEFLAGNYASKRSKWLRKLKNDFSFITRCPIKVGKNEILEMIGNSEENKGEADGIRQCAKAMTSSNHKFDRITFFTNDKGAFKMAKGFNVEVLKYKDFRNELLMQNIVIPDLKA
jgi:hypothetical protein